MFLSCILQNRKLIVIFNHQCSQAFRGIRCCCPLNLKGIQGGQYLNSGFTAFIFQIATICSSQSRIICCTASAALSSFIWLRRCLFGFIAQQLDCGLFACQINHSDLSRFRLDWFNRAALTHTFFFCSFFFSPVHVKLRRDGWAYTLSYIKYTSH